MRCLAARRCRTLAVMFRFAVFATRAWPRGADGCPGTAVVAIAVVVRADPQRRPTLTLPRSLP